MLSVAPPSASLIPAENPQNSNLSTTALVLRDFTAANGNTLPSTSGPITWPSLPSGGQYSGAPVPGQQFQPLPAAGASSGLAIVGGMIDIRGLSFNNAQAVPLTANGASASDHESRAVQDMLSSLRYVPMVSQLEGDSQQPTLAPSAPSSQPSLPSSAPSFPSSAPSAPASAPSDSTRAPSLSSTPSTSFPSSAPSSSGSYAPASTSLDSIGRQPAQHATEGGMIRLLRQPVTEESTTDTISVAAIDALMEIPAKVDGAQGKFQAFEISVISEAPLPIAPPPPGAQISSPFKPTDGKTLPAANSNLHGAWLSPNFSGTTPATALSTTAFSTTALLNTANLLAENAVPLGEPQQGAADQIFGELSPEANNEAFSSSPQLDLATATILAALIGRALWPTRAAKVDGQEKTASSRESYVRPARLRFDRMAPG